MRWFTTTLTVLAFTVPVLAEDGEPEMAKFHWNAFRIEYPKGWKLEKTKEQEHEVAIRIITPREPALVLVLTFRDDFPVPDEDDETPRNISTAFGLPIALELAGKRSERISVTWGQITFSEHWELSSRFHIQGTDGKSFQSLETFVYMPESIPHHAVLGAMISAGVAGEFNTDPSFAEITELAYRIIEDLEIQAKR